MGLESGMSVLLEIESATRARVSLCDAAGSITEGAKEMKPIGSVHRVALKGLPVQL